MYLFITASRCHTAHIIYIINRKCLSVRVSVRMGSGPLNTNLGKEIEPQFLHQNVDTSLGKVSKKDSTVIDLVGAA